MARRRAERSEEEGAVLRQVSRVSLVMAAGEAAVAFAVGSCMLQMGSFLGAA
jgi:hypothetical protein